MSKLIKGFKDIKTADIATLNNDAVGTDVLNNTDVYRKPQPKDKCIDVAKRFCWFSSSMSTATEAAMAKVPNLILKEKEQVLNSQLSQALYYLNTVAATGEQITSNVTSKFSEFMGVETKGKAKEGSGGLSKLRKLLQDKSASAGTVQRLESNYLRSLIGIYLTEDTGFNYNIPYFEKPPSITNSWGAPNNESVASGIINSGMDIVDEISSFVNLAQPGVYIQKAKHFSFADEGPSINVKFPLFNTVTRNQGDIPYQLNYELLWLLTYQNKPYKTSFARTLPPKIYDATIPGMLNMPYAYISNLEVNFVGTVRNKQVEIAGLGSFTAPIPDAYEVNIQLTSLLSDYANLMVGTGFHGGTVNNTVTIGKPTATPAKTPDPTEIPNSGTGLDPDRNGSGGQFVADQIFNRPPTEGEQAVINNSNLEAENSINNFVRRQFNPNSTNSVTRVADDSVGPAVNAGNGGNVDGLGTNPFSGN